MTRKPKISVIIPIYNVEKYLERCLLSVRNQTLTDIEIICVDDCSPDNCYKIIENHAEQDPRIVLIRHKKNKGLGGARNSAIRKAKADYIASVDSDDFILPEMLETLWNETENGWFDIVCCGFSRVDEDENILSVTRFSEMQISNDNNDINIFTAVNPAFWNKLWRKSLFFDNDIFFPNHDYYEDMSTTPRLLAKSRYVKVIKNVLYRYLVRGESIMSSVSDKHMIDYFKGFELVFRFLDVNDLLSRYHDEYWHYVKGNLLFYSKVVLSSPLSQEQKKQYLCYLVLFRITFIENFQLMKHHDLDGLIMFLRNDNLHGRYFDKYQQALKVVDAKSDYITRQLDEINRKRENIGQLTQSNKENVKKIGLLKKEYEEQIVLLKKGHEEKIALLKKGHEEKIALLKKGHEEKIVLLKKGHEEKIVLLKKGHEEKIVLFKKGYEDKINQVFNTISKERNDRVLSFGKMVAVMIFAFFTVLILTKEQQLKLINYPKKFFVDSKSPFAKWYGALFNITN